MAVFDYVNRTDFSSYIALAAGDLLPSSSTAMTYRSATGFRVVVTGTGFCL